MIFISGDEGQSGSNCLNLELNHKQAISEFHKPLNKSINPHFQDEAKCKIFLVKMSFNS